MLLNILNNLIFYTKPIPNSAASQELIPFSFKLFSNPSDSDMNKDTEGPSRGKKTERSEFRKVENRRQLERFLHQNYIKIIDDGSGIDDFTYVARHIGDSIKRKLKKQGAEHIQGEFGIGLLSFWTVGEQLMLTSTGNEGITRRLKLVKNNPEYQISPVTKELFDQGIGSRKAAWKSVFWIKAPEKNYWLSRESIPDGLSIICRSLQIPMEKYTANSI
jgi:hypothetical protein